MEIMDILSLLIPNVWTALSQLCATAILFFLMYKLAYKPVKKILAKRSQFEQSKLQEAQKLVDDNEKLAQEAKANIIESKKSADKIIEEAKKESLTIHDELVSKGKQEADELLARSKASIEQQKQQMVEDIKSQMVDVAMAATEKLLKERVDEKNDKDNIASFIKEVNDGE